MHVRNALRDAAVTACTGLTTTGTNVYSSRVFALPQAKLPCWMIYTNNEDIELATTSGLQRRVVDLVFEGVARATANIDDTLDTMLEELETAVTLSDFTQAKSLNLIGVEVEFSDEGDAPFGSITATYQIEYFTNEGAPSTAL